MLIEWMRPDFTYENESGCLRQLVHEGWTQVNVITSVAGSVRGGHYHKFNREGFYVCKGKFTLSVWNEKSSETYEMREGDMFLIPPGVFHRFDYSEDTVLVGMYDRGVELSETEKDILTK